MRSDLPTGTVTFLFTDVEGSTRLLQELGAEAYADALAEHRRVVREACAATRGVEVDTQGDAFFVAFPSASGAAAAAQAITDALASGPISLRIGLHTGTPLVTDEGYVGDDVHFAARVAASGHGGQVLFSKSTRELVDGLLVTELGEHCLKDIEGVVSIYQLGEKSFPPLKTISNTNLPRPASSFVGRERELHEVLSELQVGTRLLTLTGPGGSGKTRLALEAAAELVPAYKAGVFLIGLASLREPSLVTETIAQTIGARDGLAEHIGDRETLLLLDNIEQVIEAAPDLSELLAACPNLALLVTSRELLRVQGEVEFEVPPLASPEAVALFCERCRLEPSGEIAELCARLDNLPLAVELAAARTKALSPAQILERLSQRLDLLTGGRDADARQQTLRATIAWSYDLLSEEEQRLLRSLAVFAGGCTLEAAEDVADAHLDTLQALVEKSLVRFSEGRYWMLETIREFAGEQLMRAGDNASTAAAHAEYFAAWAERGESRFGTGDEAAWIKLFAREHDNLRAALAYSERSARQLRLASALWRFWEQQGHYSEARRWLHAALAHREGAPPTHVAGALLGAGLLARIQGDFDEAEQLMKESIAVAQDAGLRLLEARAVGSLGNIALARRDVRRGAELLAQTEALLRELGDERRLAIAMVNRAYLALEMGDFEVAFALADESRGLSRKMADALNIVSADLNLSVAARSLGREERAREALQEALELARDAGHTAFLVDALIEAAALIVSGDPTTAAELVAAADRAQQDLKLELDPVEREVRAAVHSELHRIHRGDVRGDVSDGDLAVILDEAVGRALESLAARHTPRKGER